MSTNIAKEGLAHVLGKRPRDAVGKPFLARDLALRDAGLLGVERTQVCGDLGIVRQVFDLWFSPPVGLIAEPEERSAADKKSRETLGMVIRRESGGDRQEAPPD